MHVIREAVTVHVAQDSTYAAVLAAGERSFDAIWSLCNGDYDYELVRAQA